MSNDNGNVNMALGNIGSGAVAAGRQTARAVLHDRVAHLRREADQLEALANALPDVMPVAADAALWELSIRR